MVRVRLSHAGLEALFEIRIACRSWEKDANASHEHRRAADQLVERDSSGQGADAARLGLALGRPVLVVDSTDVDTDDKPLVTKRSRFAAERVEFLVENT